MQLVLKHKAMRQGVALVLPFMRPPCARAHRAAHGAADLGTRGRGIGQAVVLTFQLGQQAGWLHSALKSRCTAEQSIPTSTHSPAPCCCAPVQR